MILFLLQVSSTGRILIARTCTCAYFTELHIVYLSHILMSGIHEFMQEFLALPRADAIHLLAQYNGNADTVIEQLFT